jgi:opacity protein-like surface antigen
VCVAVLVLVAFCLAKPACADKASRIELADGTAYENVTFSVDKLYQVVTIEVGDWKQKVDFADVARIVDQNGADVTAKVLGEKHTPVEKKQEAEWLSKQDPEYKAQQKRPFDFAIRGGGHYSFPLGDYYEGIKSGVGYGFDAVVTVARNVAIRGSVSRAGLKDDLKEMFPGLNVLQDDINLSVWRYAVCGQYYQWPDWKTGGKMLYYGFAGLGAITHKMCGTALLQEPSSGDIGEIRGTEDTESKFMLTYGGGLITMISDRVGVEFGITADVVFVGNSDDLDVVYYGKADYANIFDLKVGLVGLF